MGAPQSYSGSAGVGRTGLGGRPAVDAAEERLRGRCTQRNSADACGRGLGGASAGCERPTDHQECVDGERILLGSQRP
jgi:hypothetical protein